MIGGLEVQSAGSAAELSTDAVIVGAVRSMPTVMLVVAGLPALSVAVPMITTRVVASAGTRTGAGQTAMPDSGSAQVKVTVTGPLLQPASVTRGVAFAEMIGGVRSRLTVATLVVALPAWSTAVPGTTWAAPSVATVTG